MELVLRATFIYWFIWLVIRGSGKRELSEMSPFELILLVTIGDLVQQAVTQEDMSLTGAAIAVGTICFWLIVTSFATFRFKRVRRVLDGVPLVVVKDGEPIDRIMRLDRVTLEDVKEAAREQGISNVRDIDVGILEPDGKFSFITKPDAGQHQPEEKSKAV